MLGEFIMGRNSRFPGASYLSLPYDVMITSGHMFPVVQGEAMIQED